MSSTQSNPVLTRLSGLVPELERLYTDLHAHPELSMQETRTAGLAAERLRAAGYEVTTGIGNTGVVGVLRNGPGQTVMLRADMDALPDAVLGQHVMVGPAGAIPIVTTIVGGVVCFALRYMAIRHGWHLPKAWPARERSGEPKLPAKRRAGRSS
jgi:hypothetical protein